MTIFGQYAQQYWAKGLPVIPLEKNEKRPLKTLYGWQKYCLNMPNSLEQSHWLRNYADYNIGLPLGPQSGLVVVDVDTTDTKVQEAIYSVLPETPWVRLGRKGCALAFKMNGHRARKLLDANGNMIVEILCKGNQIVLPPSIHPDTGQPYVSNVNLYDVIDSIPELPADIEEQLRVALARVGVELSKPSKVKVTEFVSTGSRDVRMTQVAGVFAAGVTRGELTLIEAIERLRAWHVSCCQAVAGDDIDIEKGVRVLCGFLTNDVLGKKRRVLPPGWDEGLDDAQKKAMGLDFSEEQEEWNYDKAKAYLSPQLALRDDAKVATAINYALLRLSRSPNMDTLSVERILVWINKNAPDYKVAAMKKRLRELSSGDLQGTDHTQIAAAILDDLKQVGLYRHYQGGIWFWSGSHWDKVDETEIEKVIAEDYGHYPAARRASDHRGILKVLKTLLPNGLSDDEDLMNVKFVNFANGVLDENLHLQPHNPDYGATYTLPFRYLPGKELKDAPLFESFLRSSWGSDPDYLTKIETLREMMCVTLFGLGPSFARVCLLYGVAHSGKTQLMRIMENLMPDNAISRVAPYEFSERFRPVALAHSLMNVCGELSENRNIDGAKFKHFVDGGVIEAEYKHRDAFTFQPKCTHWFSSNHLPKTKDGSDGFARRWVILTFERMIRAEEKVRDLGQMISDQEKEEITSWVVGAFMRLKNCGDITLPASHHKAVMEMSADNDTVAFWFTSEGFGNYKLPDWTYLKPTMFHPSADERAELMTYPEVYLKDLYSDYATFCISQSGLKQVGMRRFSLRLRELGALKNFRMVPKLSEDVIDVNIYGLKGGAHLNLPAKKG